MTLNEFQNALNCGIKKFRVISKQHPNSLLQENDIVVAKNYTEVKYFPTFDFNNALICVDIKKLEPVFNDTEEIKNIESTDTNKHYAGEIQPIEFIQDCLKNNKNINPFQGACLKDIIKYSSRFGKKDEKLKEAKKIVDYSLWLLLETMGVKVDPRKHNHNEILKGFDIE